MIRLRNKALLLAVTILATFGTMFGQESPACPTLEIQGPWGPTQPGDTVNYTLSLTGDTVGLSFKWTTSVGTIVEGQGTRSIKLKLDEKDGRSPTATVDIIGLPEGCTSSASETSPFGDYAPQAVMIKEFLNKGTRINFAAFQELRVVGNNYPNNQMFVIEYIPAGASKSSIDRRVRQTRKYLDKLDFEADRVTVVTVEGKGKAILTKMYRVPPGALNPDP